MILYHTEYLKISLNIRDSIMKLENYSNLTSVIEDNSFKSNQKDPKLKEFLMQV